MNKLRIKTKILIAIFSGIFLALMVGLSSLMLLRAINDEIDEIATHYIPITVLISEVKTHQSSQAYLLERAMRFFFTPNGQQGQKKAEKEFWEQSEIFKRDIAKSIDATNHGINQSTNEATRSIFRITLKHLLEIKSSHKQSDLSTRQLFATLDGSKPEQAQQQIAQIEKEGARLSQELSAFLHKVEAFTANAVQNAQKHERNGYVGIASLLSFGCLIGILVALILTRSILNPLKQAIKISERIAANDLDIKLGKLDENELGQLLGSMETMAHSLNKARETVDKKVEELARSNTDLQQFAYVASHDLQEPLRTIASFSQLLAERYQGKLDSDADEFIAFMVAAANEMRTLIDDLLTFSRISTHAKPMETVDGDMLIKTIESRLQTVIKENSATIFCSKMPSFQADKAQMVQLFQNLISNAIKFHGEKPPTVHIDASRQESAWLFAVKDNGIGIDPKYGERIFEVFQRLHTKEEYTGTGIGLAVCKKIVERHGGRLTVTSKPGMGATFFISIPDFSPVIS